MNKRIIMFIIAIIFFSTVFTACGVVKGSGKIEEKEFDFTGFTQLTVKNSFDVNVSQSDEYGVTITADDNILKDYLIVDVSEDGKELIIKLKSNVVYDAMGLTLKANVKMKKLTKLDINGVSHCHLINEGFDQNETFSVEMDGASSLDGEMNSGNFDININGASKVSLKGSAPRLFIDVDGASNLNLREFEVQEAKIEANGASEIVLNVNRRIDGSVKGASSLTYYGNALVGVDQSGAASVKRAKK